MLYEASLLGELGGYGKDDPSEFDPISVRPSTRSIDPIAIKTLESTLTSLISTHEYFNYDKRKVMGDIFNTLGNHHPQLRKVYSLCNEI